MNKELHLTAKDFRIEWYSGTGAGGQKRNKVQNCCRIIHLETGLTAVGTSSRSRVTNQREAFHTLANQLIEQFKNETEVNKHEYRSEEVIRNYHAVRNEVLDKASKLRKPYKDVVIAGDISEMIEARLKTMKEETNDYSK